MLVNNVCADESEQNLYVAWFHSFVVQKRKKMFRKYFDCDKFLAIFNQQKQNTQ